MHNLFCATRVKYHERPAQTFPVISQWYLFVCRFDTIAGLCILLNNCYNLLRGPIVFPRSVFFGEFYFSFLACLHARRVCILIEPPCKFGVDGELLRRTVLPYTLLERSWTVKLSDRPSARWRRRFKTGTQQVSTLGRWFETRAASRFETHQKSGIFPKSILVGFFFEPWPRQNQTLVYKCVCGHIFSFSFFSYC